MTLKTGFSVIFILFKMLVKIIKSYRTIIIICDSNLIGKKLEQGEFQLDLKENFFKGDEKSKQEVIETMKSMVQEDATFNIVGQESVDTAIEAGIINKQGIKTIQDVPFALILL